MTHEYVHIIAQIKEDQLFWNKIATLTKHTQFIKSSDANKYMFAYILIAHQYYKYCNNIPNLVPHYPWQSFNIKRVSALMESRNKEIQRVSARFPVSCCNLHIRINKIICQKRLKKSKLTKIYDIILREVIKPLNSLRLHQFCSYECFFEQMSESSEKRAHSIWSSHLRTVNCLRIMHKYIQQHRLIIAKATKLFKWITTCRGWQQKRQCFVKKWKCGDISVPTNIQSDPLHWDCPIFSNTPDYIPWFLKAMLPTKNVCAPLSIQDAIPETPVPTESLESIAIRCFEYQDRRALGYCSSESENEEDIESATCSVGNDIESDTCSANGLSKHQELLLDDERLYHQKPGQPLTSIAIQTRRRIHRIKAEKRVAANGPFDFVCCIQFK